MADSETAGPKSITVASMTDIQVKIDTKTFSTFNSGKTPPVISQLDFTLESGEFVCLVGPSGCGKTTLLNIVAGLDNNYQGKIMLGDQHARPSIGYVFQNPRLLPWRTVRENIELTTNLTSDALLSLLKSMNLIDVQNTYPEHLSLGMSRRVSIIRAFAIDPDILLMDEPFVSLDPPTARQVRELLIRLWTQRPHTIMFVTHNLREAIALADRLIFLSAAPMSVIAEITIPIPRTERHNETEIELFRQQLFSHYPEISSLL